MPKKYGPNNFAPEHSRFHGLPRNFEEWLLPRGRIFLLGLVTANICVGLALVAYQPVHKIPMPLASVPVDKQIQLLAEGPAALALSAPEPRECRLWGPQSDRNSFDELAAQLREEGGFPEIRETKLHTDPDYLVYVGELGSREQAKRVGSELATLEIESYLIKRDDGSLILSVGLFSREKLAQNQLDKVTGLGYSAFLEELERSQTVFQLTAHVKTDSESYKSSTSSCMAIAQNS